MKDVVYDNAVFIRRNHLVSRVIFVLDDFFQESIEALLACSLFADLIARGVIMGTCWTNKITLLQAASLV